MKNLFILFAFVFTAGVMNAQSCSKKCTKKAATTEATTDVETKVASAVLEADLAADEDASIVKKVCEKSGTASFYREATCEKTGETSLTEVNYCTKSKAFVNVSPKDMEAADAKVLNVVNEADVDAAVKTGDKKACSKKCSKTCTKGKEGKTEEQ